MKLYDEVLLDKADGEKKKKEEKEEEAQKRQAGLAIREAATRTLSEKRALG